MRFRKDPDAVLDYLIDWSAWLGDTDGIATVTVTRTPEPPEEQEEGGPDPADWLTVDSTSNTDDRVTVWLSKGIPWQDYAVACLITTDDGRTDERTMTINVRER